MILPRSSSLLKRGIHVAAGVIDSDYTGEISIIANSIKNDYECEVHKGDSIAQMITLPIVDVSYQPIRRDELKTTTRGEGGFGSTGRKFKSKKKNE